MTTNLTKQSGLASNKWFALLASVMLCHNSLFQYFAVIIGKLPVVSDLESFFFPAVYLLLVVFSFNTLRFRRIKATDALVILFVILAILVTVMVYPKNTPYILEDMLDGILPCLPFFLLGLCLSLDEKTYKTISRISCIAIIVSTLYLFYFMRTRSLGGSHGENYSMYWSYVLLPNTLIAIDYSFRTKKPFAVLCAVIGVIYAFGMGTRGPIVILGAEIVVCIWKYSKHRTSRKVLALIFLAILAVIFVASPLYLLTLNALRSMLARQHVSTRVIDYMISGEMISYTSGRGDIYADLLNSLSERPILGYGIYGEYPIGYLAGAHNIYLQMVFQFGYPLGIALLASYIAVFVKALRRTKGTLTQGWIILFGCMVFIRGIFRGNWLDYAVFFLLGLCIQAGRKIDIA